MATMKIVLGNCSWDENYTHFSPNNYQYASEQNYNVSYTEMEGENLIIRANFNNNNAIRTGFKYNSLMLVNTGNIIATYRQRYYFIVGVETKNKSYIRLTCKPDILMNAYMTRGNSVQIKTIKTSGGLSPEGFNSLNFPEKDTVIYSQPYRLAISKHLNQSMNGSAMDYSDGSYYNVVGSNGLVQPQGENISSVTNNISKTFGKHIAGKVAFIPNATNVGGFRVTELPAYSSFIDNNYILDSKITQVYAKVGNDFIDLTNQLSSSYYQDGRIVFDVKNDFYQGITTQNWDGKRLNLYPAGTITVSCSTLNYTSGNKRTIFSKTYKLPKSQQLYNKYAMFKINQGNQEKARQKGAIIDLITNMIKGGLSFLTGTMDIGSMLSAGSNYAQFLISRSALIDDMLNDFTESVGGSTMGFEDIHPLLEDGLSVMVKTQSTRNLESIQKQINMLGAENYQTYTLTRAVNQLTYCEGICIVNGAEFGEEKLASIFKRGINFF